MYRHIQTSVWQCLDLDALQIIPVTEFPIEIISAQESKHQALYLI
jgi:hypothetical protein